LSKIIVLQTAFSAILPSGMVIDPSEIKGESLLLIVAQLDCIKNVLDLPKKWTDAIQPIVSLQR